MVQNELNFLSKSEQYGVLGNEATKLKIYSDEWLIHGPENLSDYGDGTCIKSTYVPKLRKLLRGWDTFARRHEIVYALFDGSLLAAYRDGNLIPYDSDADVIISFKDLEKLEKKLGDQRQNLSRKNQNETYFIIQKDWRMPENDQRRINCNSTQVASMKDSCSFIEPVGRFLSPGILREDDYMAYVDVLGYVRHYDPGQNS